MFSNIRTVSWDRIDFIKKECFHASGLCHGIGLTSWNTNVFMNPDCVMAME